MNQVNAKRVKTVRFDVTDLERIRIAALRHHLSEAEVIRKVVSVGLVDLLDGENEDAYVAAENGRQNDGHRRTKFPAFSQGGI